MFALTQKEKQEGEKMREPFVTIGLHVMKVESNRRYRIHQVIYIIACIVSGFTCCANYLREDEITPSAGDGLFAKS